jgi:hypothetical protein
MADVKHIPGPYTVENIFGVDAVDIALDYEIPSEGSPIYVGSVIHDGDGPFTLTQAIATAKLWAASPELLAACKAAKTELAYLIEQVGARPGGSVHVAFDKCLAAITKAEGDE